MSKRFVKKSMPAVLGLAMMLSVSSVAFAETYTADSTGVATATYTTEDDNSLASLGITSQGAVLDTDFGPSVWDSYVRVPAGTTKLELEPVPSVESASVTEIAGTELDANGSATVVITVTAGNGDAFNYQVHVTTDPSLGTITPEPETEVVTEAQTEAQTEKQVVETQAETEPETEDQYVRVDRNTVEQAENTINELNSRIDDYQKHISLYTKIIYGLIAVAIALLLTVINLLLRRKDLKEEVASYRSYGYSNSKKELKAQKKAARAAKKQDKNGPKGPTGGGQAPAQTPAPQQAPAERPVMPQAPVETPAPQQVPVKQRQMPQYEEAPAPQEVQQVQQVAEARQTQAAPAPQPVAEEQSEDIEIDMIDL